MIYEFHNEEYEQIILGTLMVHPEYLDTYVTEECFGAYHLYNPKNKWIYNAIFNLYAQNIEINLSTVANALEKMSKTEEAGGLAYLSSLSDKMSFNGNFAYYLKEVKELFDKREINKALIEATAVLNTEKSKTASDLAETLITDITAIQMSRGESEIFNYGEIFEELKADIDKKRRDNKDFTGIRSGFKTFDMMTGGFQPQEITILAARPSLGKTALALAMINNIVKDGVPVGFFSLEMSRLQISQRLISMNMMEPLTNIRNGLKDDTKYNAIFNEQTKKQFERYPLHVVDTPNMNLKDLKANARYLKKKYDIKIIFIDYIGLIQSDVQFHQDFERISYISNQLKQLARVLDIPIIVLCQVNRNGEEKEPTLADLRGSGSIEQDADQVLMIHGKRITNEELPERELKMMKNRNGALFKLKLDFHKKYTMYMEHIENEES